MDDSIFNTSLSSLAVPVCLWGSLSCCSGHQMNPREKCLLDYEHTVMSVQAKTVYINTQDLWVEVGICGTSWIFSVCCSPAGWPSASPWCQSHDQPLPPPSVTCSGTDPCSTSCLWPKENMRMRKTEDFHLRCDFQEHQCDVCRTDQVSESWLHLMIRLFPHEQPVPHREIYSTAAWR